MNILIMDHTVAMRARAVLRPGKTQVLAAAVGGGAIGAFLGSLLVVAQSALTNVSALWISGALLAGAGVLVGGFIGAMMMQNVERQEPNP